MNKSKVPVQITETSYTDCLEKNQRLYVNTLIYLNNVSLFVQNFKNEY